jgi:putative nucleotidyltransferase with HDIG domain
VIAAVFVLFELNPDILGLPGIAFWVVATFLAAALPVVLPRGTVVSVSAAPVMAATFLGGPMAAMAVGALGSTDVREIRGEVPWYGTLYNHASIVIAAVVASLVYEFVVGLAPESAEVRTLVSFGGALLSGSALYALNWTFSVAAVSSRTGQPFRTVLGQDVYGVARTMIGLVPLAWLMALIFQQPNGIGWWATALFIVPLFTTRLAFARYVETRELFEQTISALSKAVDARDKYTRNHSSRVSHISEAMCRVMRLPEHEIEKIKWAGLLHDVGKIGIRDHILLKEGPLDKSERILMNQHPTIGAEIVAPATQLSEEAPLIKAHHEWFNGSGYPDGVEALDIPLGARILTIADAYEAMTSSRPYRKIPLTHEQAVDQLEKFSGIQFDPDIVPILVNLDRDILDRPPDREDELPTMLHQLDPRDVPAEPVRQILAADDVS